MATTNRSRILSQFTVGIADHLMVFADSLADIDADILVFMARKSYCLYRVLTSLGARPANVIIASDRVLDFDLSFFQGKTIALIDDTLFVGSSLAKTKLLLEGAGARRVTTHIFCRNRDWHDRRLIEPDSVAIELDDLSTRTFCSAAVRALSIAPRPYNVDFPLFQTEKISISELEVILSSIRWNGINLSSDNQERNSIRTYTFFPSDAVFEEFSSIVGNELAHLAYVIKVRTFVRIQPDKRRAWLTVVPIILNEPVWAPSLEGAIESLEQLPAGTTSYLSWASSPKSQLKVVQTWSSLIVGHRFLDDIGNALDRPMRSKPNLEELSHHLGPWHQSEIRSLAASAEKANAQDQVCNINLPSPPDTPPADSHQVGKDLIHDSPLNIPSLFSGDDLVAAFGQLFVDMYDRRELPSRREFHQSTNPVALLDRPKVDRLDFGISFTALHEFFRERFDGQSQYESARILSLVLDVCNDLGIAVPITVMDDDWLWRAYRHGEDVKFTDGEVDLAYYAVKAYMEAADRTSIPAIALEKLLVILIRIGAARGFLEPLHGDRSVASVVEIQMDLKGAVSRIRTGPKRRSQSDMWLSAYLVRRKVLKRRGRQPYELGEPVDATFAVDHAPESATEIGSMIGLLASGSASPCLSEKDLIVLATVEPPRDGLAAISAELDIVNEEFRSTLYRALPSTPPSDPVALESLRKAIVRNDAYEAVHSARFKLEAIKEGRHATLVKRGAECLAKGGSIPSKRMAERWIGYWQSVGSGTNAIQEQLEVTPMLDALAESICEIGVALILAETAIVGLLGPNAGARELQKAKSKLVSYSESMRSMRIPQRRSVTTIVRRLSSDGDNFDWERAYEFALATLSQALEDAPALIASADPIIERRHGMANRRDYSYVLWYDIVDSTSTVSARSGVDVDIHDSQVTEFRRLMNQTLQQLVYRGRNQQTDVYAWNGDVDSTNDEKHIFFGGARALPMMRSLADDVARFQLACPMVKIRMYCIQADFAGVSPYKYVADMEVQSARFWEHLSRIKKELRSIESARLAASESFFAIVGDRLTHNFGTLKNWIMMHSSTVEVVSESHFLERRTQVRISGIRPRGIARSR